MALPVQVAFPQAPTLPAFEVVSYVLEDGLSRLFDLALDALVADAALPLDQVVGQRVQVSFDDQPFVGVVSGLVVDACQHTAEPMGLSRYGLHVAPRLWLAKRRRGYHIFQDTDAADVADLILRSLGEANAVRVFTGPALRVQEYRALYEESYHDCLFRTLAEDGLTLLLDHAANGAVVLLDDTSSAPLPRLDLPWKPTNLLAAGPAVLSFHRRAALSFARTRVNDYDLEHPSLGLEARQVGSALFTEEGITGWQEWAEGHFTTSAAGQARALCINEEHRAEHEGARATTTHSLPPGVQLTIAGHPNSDGPWLVAGLRSEVTELGPQQIEARHEVDLRPASLRFRPPRWPRPRVQGTQTALVISRSGQQVDVDALGRVEVGMRWDPRAVAQGGQTSRRVRVARPWGGALRGFAAFPRVGDEVVLDFLDGDPDRPIVVGCVHNATQPIPQRVPSEEGVTTWRSASLAGDGGYNEVLMDDAAGAERLHLRAQRDYQTFVGNNAAHQVVGNAEVAVVGSAEVRAEHVVVKATADLLTVSPNWSSYSEMALIYPVQAFRVDSTGGEISLKAGGASIVMAGGKITLDAPEGITITAAGGDVTINGAPKIKLNP